MNAPITLHPETTPRWLVRPVPTLTDIQAAHLAKLDSWLAWLMADDADKEDRWAEYMGAIENHADLEHRRYQAIMQEIAG